MTEKEIIYNLISGSIIEKLIEHTIDIDIEHPYGISRLKGVYVLIFEKRERKPYIGSTTDIHQRLTQHRNRTKTNIENVIFLRTKDKEDALSVEDWLITNLDCSNKINAIYHKKVIIECSEDTRMMILKKQLEFKEKYGSKPYIKDMVDIAIEAGIDEIEERLGLNRRKIRIKQKIIGGT